MVGLIPLFAVETLEPELLERAAGLRRAAGVVPELPARPGGAGLALARAGPRRAPAAVAAARPPHEMPAAAHAGRDRVPVRLRRARAVARVTRDHPYVLRLRRHRPRRCAISRPSRDTGLFGGNSNWRGPIWLPVNYLLIESLQKFHHYYGDDFKVECPTGSGQFLTLERGRRRAGAPADAHLPARTSTAGGRCCGSTRSCRPIRTSATTCSFYEYFHGDTGRGVGASHQTGWTGLVAKLLMPRAHD